MKELFKQTFNVAPVAQGRPRISRIGGGVRAIDPPKSREYKASIGLIAALYCKEKLPDVPLDIVLNFVLPIPKSWSKKKQQEATEGKIVPTSRPDLDNYVKAMLDALNDVVWEDDSAIVGITARKTYGEKPMVQLAVYEHEIWIY